MRAQGYCGPDGIANVAYKPSWREIVPQKLWISKIKEKRTKKES
jgi:hypothetical protein